VLHFYDVGGLLIRRWVPAQRRVMLEVWSGDGWAPYPDVDQVSRHGSRLTDEQSLQALHETRARCGALPPLSDEEADRALRARQRRA
jgi:hypothetical protein